MKNYLLAFLLIFSLSILAQTSEQENIQYLKITQKKCIKRKGYHLMLKEVVSDSRCPADVTCIWAGEVQIVVSVYLNRKLIEDQTITISPIENQGNKDWFSNYLPAHQKKIKSIWVVPYPKDGVAISPKDYYVKIGYIKK